MSATKIYALPCVDGGVKIMQTTVNPTTGEHYSPQECLAKWHPNARAEITGEVIEVPSLDAIPQDRSFRSAWKFDGGFSVDMPKARNIHRDRMRKARALKLAALDVEAMRAVEESKPLAPIVQRKQELRDVTALPAIEAARTPEELKAVWPDCLR